MNPYTAYTDVDLTDSVADEAAVYDETAALLLEYTSQLRVSLRSSSGGYASSAASSMAAYSDPSAELSPQHRSITDVGTAYETTDLTGERTDLDPDSRVAASCSSSDPPSSAISHESSSISAAISTPTSCAYDDGDPESYSSSASLSLGDGYSQGYVDGDDHLARTSASAAKMPAPPKKQTGDFAGDGYADVAVYSYGSADHLRQPIAYDPVLDRIDDIDTLLASHAQQSTESDGQGSTLSETKSSDRFDWNGRFQALNEMETTPEVAVAQRRLVDEFTSNATLIAKRIIAEMFLPEERKTIRPVDAGGIAGGLKFIEQGTFFKFALDVFNIYNGDGNAAKAAGHEINGLMNLLRVCQLRAIFSRSTAAETALLSKLYFPLMAVVRYRGYSMICTSLVPISGRSLIYGSDDGGKTVHADIDQVNRLVEICARRLNLKGHWVGFNDQKFLHLPGDIEIHKSDKDGRFYCLDTARVFPPTKPNFTIKGSFLYRLFRPEFVINYSTPLSSDAWTNWGRHNSRVHNAEVTKATEVLTTEHVVVLANFLIELFGDIAQCRFGEEVTVLMKSDPSKLRSADDSASSSASASTPASAAVASTIPHRDTGDGHTDHGDQLFGCESIKRIAHMHGVNLRYLGLVRQQVPPQYAHIRKILLAEVCARAAKNCVLEQLRRARPVTEEDEVKAYAHAFNLLFRQSQQFWVDRWRETVCLSFDGTLSAGEQMPQITIDHLLGEDGLAIVFARIQFLLGIACLRNVSTVLGTMNYASEKDLVPRDFRPQYLPTVRNMYLFDFYEAYHAVQKAQELQRGVEAKRLYTEGVRGYQRALSHFPGDSASFQNYGIALSALGDLAAEEGDLITAGSLYENASRQFSFGAVVNPRDSHLLTTWVHVLTSQAKACASPESLDAKIALLRRADRLSERASQCNSENYFVYDHWGLALSHLGRSLASCARLPDDYEAVDQCFEKAAAKFSRASELDPDPSTLLNRGLSHWYHAGTCSHPSRQSLALDLFAQAKNALEKAIQVDGTLVPAHYNYALVLLDQAKYVRDPEKAAALLSTARETLRKCTSLDSSYWRAKLSLALTYTEEAERESSPEKIIDLTKRSLLDYLKAAREHPEVAIIFDRAERALSRLMQHSPLSAALLDEVHLSLVATVKAVGTAPSSSDAGKVHILLGDVLLQKALLDDDLSDERANKIYELFVTGVSIVARMDPALRADLPAFFSCPRLTVVFEALRCCRKISVFESFQRMLVISCGVIDAIKDAQLLQAGNPALPYESVWTLANLSCCDENRVQLASDTSLIDWVIRLLSHPTPPIPPNAARVLYQLTRSKESILALLGNDPKEFLARLLNSVTPPIDPDTLTEPGVDYGLDEGGARIPFLEPLTQCVYAVMVTDTETYLPLLVEVELSRGFASLLYLFTFKTQETMMLLFRLFFALLKVPDHAPAILALFGKYLIHFDLHGVSVLEVLSSVGDQIVFDLLRRTDFLTTLLQIAEPRIGAWDDYVSNLWCKLVLRIALIQPDLNQPEAPPVNDQPPFQLSAQQLKRLRGLVDRLQVAEHRDRMTCLFV